VPPPAPGAKPQGRPRKKGVRLPGMAAWAADLGQLWEVLTFDQFGLHATLWVKTIRALYYGAGKDRVLTIVLVRDPKGKRPDQMFFCTRWDWEARPLLAAYAHRWAIEVTFENGKQLLGLEDPANRVPKAVSRTAALALLLYSLVVLWVQRSGHAWVEFPERPWYGHKREASFADLLSALRRRSWAARFAGVLGNDGPLEKELRWLIEFASRAG